MDTFHIASRIVSEIDELNELRLAVDNNLWDVVNKIKIILDQEVGVKQENIF